LIIFITQGLPSFVPCVFIAPYFFISSIFLIAREPPIVQPDSANQESLIRILVQKLTPRLLVGFLSLAILILAAVIQITVLSAGPESLNQFKISTPKEQDRALRKAEDEVLTLRWELASKDEQLAALLNKTSAKPAACREEPDSSTDLSRQLYLLEKAIPQYGSSVSTLLEPDFERKKVYLQIQTVLKGLGFYQGQLDGDQQRTRAAVVHFQKVFNASLKNLGPAYRPQKIDHLGVVGYRTLEAMRSTYRQQKLKV
jgi:hypothetical protein